MNGTVKEANLHSDDRYRPSGYYRALSADALSQVKLVVPAQAPPLISNVILTTSGLKSSAPGGF